jgi:hypothetical protein
MRLDSKLGIAVTITIVTMMVSITFILNQPEIYSCSDYDVSTCSYRFEVEIAESESDPLSFTDTVEPLEPVIFLEIIKGHFIKDAGFLHSQDFRGTFTLLNNLPEDILEEFDLSNCIVEIGEQLDGNGVDVWTFYDYEGCDQFTDSDTLHDVSIEGSRIRWCVDNPDKEYGFYGFFDSNHEMFWCDERREIVKNSIKPPKQEMVDGGKI